MDRQGLTEEIRRTALAEGADLVGFAPIARFDNAPPHLHPRTLFPPVCTVRFRIEDVEFGHGELNCEACVKVHQGMDPRFSPFWNGSEKEGEAPAYNQFCKERFRHLAICGGRGCLRACLDHLEKRGRITTKFKTPFIERKRWKLNEPPAPKEKEHKQ